VAHELRIWECRRCAQIFLWPLASEEEIRSLFDTLYATGESPYPELRSYYAFCLDDAPSNPLVQLYERWLTRLERVRPPGRLLDIGCGTGLFLDLARRRGWTPFGIDECAEATGHARSRFGLAVETADFESFPWGDRQFDAVTMWDIIEHARRPVDLLAAVRQRLAPGGVIAIATPNQASILHLIAGALYHASGGRIQAPLNKMYLVPHFLYFTPQSLAETARRAGLEIVTSELESTELQRLTLSPPVRLALEAAFWIARRTGLENRLFAIVRAAGEPGAG
jgi:SAM-dependent methyltransferase